MMGRVIPDIYYRPIHFKAVELVPKPMYDELGEKVWALFDSRLLYTADCLREVFGTLICNTWCFGGSSQYRGYRPEGCKIGANWSQHKNGRALDLVSPKVTAEELRLKVIEKNRLFKYISRIEKTVSWLHFEVANFPGNEVVLF